MYTADMEPMHVNDFLFSGTKFKCPTCDAYTIQFTVGLSTISCSSCGREFALLSGDDWLDTRLPCLNCGHAFSAHAPSNFESCVAPLCSCKGYKNDIYRKVVQ